MNLGCAVRLEARVTVTACVTVRVSTSAWTPVNATFALEESAASVENLVDVLSNVLSYKKLSSAVGVLSLALHHWASCMQTASDSW